MTEFQTGSEDLVSAFMDGDRHKSIVTIENLTKIYGKGPTRVIALRKLNLNILRGEFIAILGPSGSGKTTFLNMIGALDRPTTGRVVIDHVEASKVPERLLYRIRREKLGFIFQTYYLVPTLTAFQNVLTPVLPVRESRRYHKQAERLLKIVGLQDRMHHKPGELSGGEQQRVAIARALILNPKVILADEPTGNLDTKTGMDIMDLLYRLNTKAGKTLIVVTHDHRLAQKAGRVLYLVDGMLYNVAPEGF
jgi:putative ABC transport system ATP-binding protein